jgi:hypothetical protein
MAVSYTHAELFADLNSCQYLFLRDTAEPRENSLRLLIEEGIPSPEPVSLKIAGTVITDCHKVTVGENARRFEICWDSYVAYSIRNESFVVADDESEKFELGNLVRVYSESKFLEYVRSATIAHDEYPGPTRHIEIVS